MGLFVSLVLACGVALGCILDLSPAQLPKSRLLRDDTQLKESQSPEMKPATWTELAGKIMKLPTRLTVLTDAEDAPVESDAKSSTKESQSPETKPATWTELAGKIMKLPTRLTVLTDAEDAPVKSDAKSSTKSLDWWRGQIAQEEHYLIFGVVLPYIMRLEWLGYVLSMLWKAHLLKALDFPKGYLDWNGALDKLSLQPAKAYQYVAVKVVFWHLLQPVMYFLVFFQFYPLLGTVMRALGWVVAFRESLYTVVIFTVLCGVPGVYLFSPLQARTAVTRVSQLYFFMPEKFLLLSVAEPVHPELYAVSSVIICILDACGGVAFITMTLCYPVQLYVPMMIGFGVTSLSLVVFVPYFVQAGVIP